MPTMNGVPSNGATNGVEMPTMNGGAGSRQPTKMSGIGPDGYPRLPPIRKPGQKIDDPYANSKLMTFRLANHKQALLMQIL